MNCKEVENMENIEKIKMNVEGMFWTRKHEMEQELESLDYSVVYSSYEYLIVIDELCDDDDEYKLHLGHANGTMWVENVELA